MAARVLVAEDDNAVRLLVGTLLRRASYRVDFASDGAETIASLESNDYDAVVLDLMMPGASGFEVLAWLHRTKRGLARSRVIVLTAVAATELKHLTSDRVFAVIRKPFDNDDLMATVKRCVEGAASPS